MKFLQSSKGLYTLAFLLIIVTNIFILMGVSSNRSEITSSITMTERELQIPYSSNKENTGISLNIKWRVLNTNKKISYYYNRQASWLNKDELKSLGFDIQNITKQKKYKPAPKKEVFLVLEYDGDAYKTTLEQIKLDLVEKQKQGNKLKIKNATKALHVEQNSASRLFVIAAGNDYTKLREIYKDTSKYIIAKGIVKAHYNIQTKELSGYINSLSVTSLHVELKYKQILTKLTKNKSIKYNSDEKPRYKVKVKYGSRYEPWVSGINIQK